MTPITPIPISPVNGIPPTTVPSVAGAGPGVAELWANAANGARQVVASAMAPSALRVIISLSLLVPSRQRMKKAPAGLFDPWTCEWQLMHSLWFASAELKKVLGGAPRCGIDASPPK